MILFVVFDFDGYLQMILFFNNNNIIKILKMEKVLSLLKKII